MKTVYMGIARYIALLLAVVGLASLAGYFFDFTKASAPNATATTSSKDCSPGSTIITEANDESSEREALFVSCGGFLE